MITWRSACSGWIDVPVLHFEHGSPILAWRAGIAVGQFAADHGLDDAVFADLGRCGVERVDRLAVADDGDAVGDLQYLVELVGDQDRGNALRLELLQQRQQRIGIGFVEA